MENTIKNLMERSQNIERLLEKGEKTIIVQLGSHSIKMNFANQTTPVRIRTLLAYKCKKPEKTSAQSPEPKVKEAL